MKEQTLNPSATETRNHESGQVEIRSADDGKRIISGYAVKWNKDSRKLANRFFEQFKPGAFRESLATNDIRALWSHDWSKVLGGTKNGTLRLLEDDIGLRFELDLPNNTIGDDAFESIQRGDIDGVSFGFRAVQQNWERRGKTDLARIITKADLFEISPVGMPAYPDTSISTRELEQFEREMNGERRKRLVLQTLI